MKIEYLSDHIHVIPELASFHLEYFGQFNPQLTLESREAQLHLRTGKSSIPLTLVALDQNKPVGSACLVEHDLPGHPDLTPWVSSVIVRSELRRMGIGSALMKRIEQEGARLGYEKLYLFTPDMEAFYSQLGWVVIGREMYRDNEVVIMEKLVGVDSPIFP